MHFSEDDLRSALKRKDPGAAFTQRVMARIHQAEATVSTPKAGKTSLLQPWWRLRLRTALAGVIVTALALVACLGFVHYRQVQKERAGELAKQQAILALRITTSKLSHVFERVSASQAREFNDRREHL